MKTLAIIGTGISGLSAAWFLRDRYKLTVFEKNNYVGGHTNTVTVEEEGRQVPIDTGFMVFNLVTYPLLTRLFNELGVATKPTDMSFSVQYRPANLEFNGGSMSLLFGQRRNLLNLRHWKMLVAINRFNNDAVPALSNPRYRDYTLGQYIDERGYGRDMLDRYLVPMSSAVWSTPPHRMLDFPAMTLLRFWHNHGFLGLNTRHDWYTVEGGAKNYVKTLTSSFRDAIQLNSGVVGVRRSHGKAVVVFEGGETRSFDKVILACHGNQALDLLEDPTDLEQRLLSCFKYQKNLATLHTDSSVMPVTQRCWASWNYRVEGLPGSSRSSTIHYWMNSLQDVSRKKNYFVSLDYQDRIDHGKILREISYEHPLFDLAAVRAQDELPSLNQLSEDQTTYYAGAWFKYGFHEDGLASGLACASAVVGEPLWGNTLATEKGSLPDPEQIPDKPEEQLIAA